MIYCKTFFVLLYLFVYATQRKWVILEGNMVGYCIGQLFFYIVVAKFQVFIFQNILKPTFYYILKLLFLFYKDIFYWANVYFKYYVCIFWQNKYWHLCKFEVTLFLQQEKNISYLILCVVRPVHSILSSINILITI